MNYRAFITVGQMVSFGLVWGFDAVKNIVQFYCTMIEYRIYIYQYVYILKINLQFPEKYLAEKSQLLE
jgi:uncharacterized membrane protein YcfT